MRVFKLAMALAGLLSLVQYIPAYYHASEFENFLRHEVQRTRSTGKLRREILDQAGAYALRLNDDDIDITKTGAVFRVAVNCRVPVDFLVYRHELMFRTVDGGLLAD